MLSVDRRKIMIIMLMVAKRNKYFFNKIMSSQGNPRPNRGGAGNLAKEASSFDCKCVPGSRRLGQHFLF